MSDLTPIDDSDARLEAIAKDIELLQDTAILRVAERLAEAHKIFLYRRDEGGWVESRLKFSRRTAYNLLNVHERFGDSVQQLHTLPRSVLYMLAAPSTPEAASDEVIERSEAGERLTPAQIKEIIDKAVEPQLEALRAEAFQREAELRAEYEAQGKQRSTRRSTRPRFRFKNKSRNTRSGWQK